MEWTIKTDGDDSVAEHVADGVETRLTLFQDLQDEIHVHVSTASTAFRVWLPVSVVARMIPNSPNRDCHELRNAIQVLMMAEGDADILTAGYEVRRMVSAMKERVS